MDDFGPVILMTGHGSISSRNRIVNHTSHHIIHPCPENWTVDTVLQNLMLKLFTSAESAHDLCVLRQMLEAFPSTFTVLSDREPQNLRESQTMLQHRISPARELDMTFAFNPNRDHQDYKAHHLFCAPSEMLNVHLHVCINLRKLFQEVADSDADSSVFRSNHTIFLQPTQRFRTNSHIFLSEVIDSILPNWSLLSCSPPTLQRIGAKSIICTSLSRT